MSNSPTSTSNTPFLVLASLIIVAAAGLTASVWPAVADYRHSQSMRLIEEGSRLNAQLAALDYRLAYALDDHNSVAATQVAVQDLAAGHLQAASRAIAGAGESRSANRVRIQVALEANDKSTAIKAARELLNGVPSEGDVALAALVDGRWGSGGQSRALMARVSSPEGLRHVQAAELGNVTLAQELYARGLVNASQQVLAAAPTSLPRNLLLAHLKLMAKKPDYAAIGSLYKAVVQIDPTNIEARQGLISVLKHQKNTAEADNQTSLLNRLLSGKP